MDLDPRLERLLAREACTKLVLRMARAIDRCDAELLKSLFHPDATDDHGLFSGTATDFVPWVMGVLGGMVRTQHLIGNVLIEVDGDEARGESYFLAHHVLPGESGEQTMVAAGRYLDRFARRDGQWRITRRHAVYDWSSTAPNSDIWDRANMPGFSFGARGADDPSYAHFAR